MSTDAVLRLEKHWTGSEVLQTSLERAFDYIGFDEDSVDRAIALSDSGKRSKRPKYVKDNVWGMMRLEWRTMVLIDCPVLQRLRGIKQLGLSYLVYPSAEHSRFAHSLGMAHLVSELLEEATKRCSEDQDGEADVAYVDERSFAPLRRDEIVLAAVLHDIGHMPFSHATESILTNRGELFTCGPLTVSELREDAARYLKKSLGLAEILSLLVILSTRFRRFYDGCIGRGLSGSDSLLRVASLIAGLPPEPRLSGLADVISAATVDADKIDYINRDARACGIPVGLDVSRTLLRCGFVEATRDVLRKAELKDDPAPSELVFIVNASGMDTVDEITQARAALYQRVYLHGVTRTAEAVLARALEANAAAEDGLTDATDALCLWCQGDDELLARLLTSPAPDASKLARRLALRNLPKKACVFSSALASTHFPIDQLFRRTLTSAHASTLRKQISQTRLEGLKSVDMLAKAGRDLERDVGAECGAIASLLRANGWGELPPPGEVGTIISIGTAYMDKVRKDGIVLQNGELLRTSRFTNAREQQDAFDIFKAVGYIMSEPEWRVIALIASRTVLARAAVDLKPATLREENDEQGQLPVRLLRRMIIDLDGTIRRAGLKKAEVLRVVRALSEIGYFDDKPHLALRTDPGAQAVVQVAKKLQSFEGQHSWAVTTASISAFVDQFPPRLREPVLHALGELTLFDSTTLSTNMLPAIRKIAESCGCDVAALTPNSGSRVREALEREGQHLAGVRFHKEVASALRGHADAPLILVDDNTSSGTQARAQFLSWLGEPRETWPNECRQEDGITEAALAPDDLERLRARPVHVMVCAGRGAANAALTTFVRGLGVINFAGLNATREIEASVRWTADLKAFLEEVGLSLIAWTRYGKTPDELSTEERQFCQGRAFGYGNFGALVATTDSVPTATATAFWCPGMFEGRPWMPLMLRRNKLRHLILA